MRHKQYKYNCNFISPTTRASSDVVERRERAHASTFTFFGCLRVTSCQGPLRKEVFVTLSSTWSGFGHCLPLCCAGIPVIYKHIKQSLKAESLSRQEEREIYCLTNQSKETPGPSTPPRKGVYFHFHLSLPCSSWMYSSVWQCRDGREEISLCFLLSEF